MRFFARRDSVIAPGVVLSFAIQFEGLFVLAQAIIVCAVFLIKFTILISFEREEAQVWIITEMFISKVVLSEIAKFFYPRNDLFYNVYY